MPKSITLSDSTKVHLREKFTHKMHKVLFTALNKGVVWKQDLDSGEFQKELPAINIELQYEAIFELLIEKITDKSGKEVAYSHEWLDDLSQADYRLLEEAAALVRFGPPLKDEDGQPVTGEGGEKKV